MNDLDKIAPALVAAQKQMKVAVKGTENTFFKSKYADLGAVWEACHEALSTNGIAVVQSGVTLGSEFYLRTTLLHSSGQILTGDYLIKPEKTGPQALGSAYTYARRYSLAAMVGVIAEDDDAEAATVHEQPGARPAAVAQAQPKQEASGTQDVYKRTFIPESFNCRAWEKNGKAGLRATIKDEAGDEYSSLDEKCIESLKNAASTGQALNVAFKVNGKYRNIVSVKEAEKVEVPF